MQVLECLALLGGQQRFGLFMCFDHIEPERCAYPLDALEFGLNLGHIHWFSLQDLLQLELCNLYVSAPLMLAFIIWNRIVLIFFVCSSDRPSSALSIRTR